MIPEIARRFMNIVFILGVGALALYEAHGILTRAQASAQVSTSLPVVRTWPVGPVVPALEQCAIGTASNVVCVPVPRRARRAAVVEEEPPPIIEIPVKREARDIKDSPPVKRRKAHREPRPRKRAPDRMVW